MLKVCFQAERLNVAKMATKIDPNLSLMFPLSIEDKEGLSLQPLVAAAMNLKNNTFRVYTKTSFPYTHQFLMLN